mmetsp:Transcript_19759/g.54405  ORF Transcript_19759/g.54405 Transcript_19759/m.54405 type:complete len:214 (-) Transcript_19759:7-648(-)
MSSPTGRGWFSGTSPFSASSASTRAGTPLASKGAAASNAVSKARVKGETTTKSTQLSSNMPRKVSACLRPSGHSAQSRNCGCLRCRLASCANDRPWRTRMRRCAAASGTSAARTACAAVPKQGFHDHVMRTTAVEAQRTVLRRRGNPKGGAKLLRDRPDPLGASPFLRRSGLGPVIEPAERLEPRRHRDNGVLHLRSCRLRDGRGTACALSRV